MKRADIETLAQQSEWTDLHPPMIVVTDGSEGVDEYSAGRFISEVHDDHFLVASMPTGETQRGVYSRLVQAQSEGRVDFSGMTAKNLDEYYPLKSGHPHGYEAYMRTNFIDQIPPIAAWHIPDSAAPDPYEEAARYENVMMEGVPVRIAMLGLGPELTCHIGFNERGSVLNSRTRFVEELDPSTQQANAKLFSNPLEMPRGAITQGIGNILESDMILVNVKGAHKAPGVERTLLGPISPDAPASFLRLHPRVTFAMDRAAAARLS